MKKLSFTKTPWIQQKKYVGLFVFFFIVGILWGKFFYFNEQNRAALFQKPTLNLLAEKDFLLSDIIESFSMETGIDLNVIVYSTKEDLALKIQNKNIDMVAFKSYDAELIMKSLSRLSNKEVQNKEYISVDFKNPPYDHDNQFSVPLFWGVTKGEKIEQTLLWIESLGITKNSHLKKEAHKFLDYTLKPEIALQVIKYRKIASTNKSVEKAANIEPKLKPSYLRKISIRNLSFTERAGF